MKHPSSEDIFRPTILNIKNSLQLLTTEKDFLRLDDLAKKDIEYVNTELIINNEERLMKKIIFYENN